MSNRNHPLKKKIAQFVYFFETGSRGLNNIKLLIIAVPAYLKLFLPDLSVRMFLPISVISIFLFIILIIGIGYVLDRWQMIDYIQDEYYHRSGSLKDDIKDLKK